MKPCKTCPFLASTKNFGREDWLIDVKDLVDKNSTEHSGHCTDERADGYIKGTKKLCNGMKMVDINDRSKIRIHKKAFKNWKEFFMRHITANIIYTQKGEKNG